MKSLENCLSVAILFTVIREIFFIEVVSRFVYMKTYFPSTCKLLDTCHFYEGNNLARSVYECCSKMFVVMLPMDSQHS